MNSKTSQLSNGYKTTNNKTMIYSAFIFFCSLIISNIALAEIITLQCTYPNMYKQPTNRLITIDTVKRTLSPYTDASTYREGTTTTGNETVNIIIGDDKFKYIKERNNSVTAQFEIDRRTGTISVEYPDVPSAEGTCQKIQQAF